MSKPRSIKRKASGAVDSLLREPVLVPGNPGPLVKMSNFAESGMITGRRVVSANLPRTTKVP